MGMIILCVLGVLFFGSTAIASTIYAFCGIVLTVIYAFSKEESVFDDKNIKYFIGAIFLSPISLFMVWVCYHCVRYLAHH